MKLPEDTHLAYIVMHESWWWRGDEYPSLMISASAKGNGGGVAWEFQVNERELGGRPVTRAQIFDDAYAAFAQVPELFAAMAETGPSRLTEVIALLLALGAVDETERVSPYPARRVQE